MTKMTFFEMGGVIVSKLVENEFELFDTGAFPWLFSLKSSKSKLPGADSTGIIRRFHLQPIPERF